MEVIEITKYGCPYCEARYDTKEEAISCAETHHTEFTVIRGENYVPHGRIPEYMIIEDNANGAKYKYRRYSY